MKTPSKSKAAGSKPATKGKYLKPNPKAVSKAMAKQNKLLTKKK